MFSPYLERQWIQCGSTPIVHRVSRLQSHTWMCQIGSPKDGNRFISAAVHGYPNGLQSDPISKAAPNHKHHISVRSGDQDLNLTSLGGWSRARFANNQTIVDMPIIKEAIVVIAYFQAQPLLHLHLHLASPAWTVVAGLQLIGWGSVSSSDVGAHQQWTATDKPQAIQRHVRVVANQVP